MSFAKYRATDNLLNAYTAYTGVLREKMTEDHITGQWWLIPSDKEIQIWVKDYPNKQAVLEDCMFTVRQINDEVHQRDRIQKERFPDWKSQEFTNLCRHLGRLEDNLIS